jgi:hypothetical protein
MSGLSNSPVSQLAPKLRRFCHWQTASEWQALCVQTNVAWLKPVAAIGGLRERTRRNCFPSDSLQHELIAALQCTNSERKKKKEICTAAMGVWLVMTLAAAWGLPIIIVSSSSSLRPQCLLLRNVLLIMLNDRIHNVEEVERNRIVEASRESSTGRNP